MTYGAKLKGEREAVGMSQADLAAAAGLSVQAVRSYEQQLRLPAFAHAVRLADALGVAVEEFAATVREKPSQVKKRR
jgi:transcriptional regulator with XRE-family HTH domain